MVVNSLSSFIGYLHASKYRTQLESLLGKMTAYGLSLDDIQNIVGCNIGRSDLEIFLALEKKIHSLSSEDEEKPFHRFKKEDTYDFVRQRISLRVKDIKNLLKNAEASISPGSKFLDLGSGNCSFTEHLGLAVGILKEDIYGADQESWLGSNIVAPPSQNFLPIVNNTIPCPSDFFSLVSMFQSLHHFQNLSSMLEETRRITTKGSYIIVREHNSERPEDEMLINLEHFMHALLQDGVDPKLFAKDFFGSYKSIPEWHNVFSTYGFSNLYTTKPSGPSQIFYACYIKTKG